MRNIVTTAALRTYIAAEGLMISEDASDDQVLDTAMKIGNANSSQAKCAAWLINVTEGNVTSDDIETVLRERFPGAKIGGRHGAHFASLSRSGKLKGCRFEVAKAGRTSSGAKHELKRLRALVETIRDAKNIKNVRDAINAYDNPVAE